VNKVLIEEMSWSEFRQAMASTDLIIFPTGSVEEHGPHNPLGADLIVARAIARAVGEKTGALVAPVMPIGNARGLLGFPGTVHLDPDLLRQVIVSVCACFVHHGAKRFLFINGHGGNASPLRLACADLYDDYGVIATHSEWWTALPHISEFKCDDHGGKYETSMVMAVDGSLVNMTEAKTLARRNLTPGLTYEEGLQFRGAAVPMPVPLHMVSDRGNYGARAEEASRTMGDAMFAAYVDFCAGLVEELRMIPLL